MVVMDGRCVVARPTIAKLPRQMQIYLRDRVCYYNRFEKVSGWCTCYVMYMVQLDTLILVVSGFYFFYHHTLISNII